MNTNNPTENKPKSYSQLKAMAAIMRASFKASLRSPSAIVFGIIFPLIFILVFGFLGGGSAKMDVVLAPGSDTTSPIYHALKAAPMVNFKDVSDTALTRQLLAKGSVDALISIPKGTPTEVQVTPTAASMDQGQSIIQLLQGIAAQINLQKVPKDEIVATIKAMPPVAGRPYQMIDFILPGQLGFSLLSTGIFGTAFVFFNLRETLVIKRFFATPIQRSFIVLGEAFSRILFALIGALIIVLIGHYAFGFTLMHGPLTVLNMMVLSMLSLIVFMGFGFTISGLAKSDSAIPPMANLITLPQFLLAGTFFPVSSFPGWLQPVSNALPLTYLNSALRKVAFEGKNLLDVWVELAVLLGWGIIIYIIAGRVFRWE